MNENIKKVLTDCRQIVDAYYTVNCEVLEQAENERIQLLLTEIDSLIK